MVLWYYVDTAGREEVSAGLVFQQQGARQLVMSAMEEQKQMIYRVN